jgi:hypothetical protein
VCVCVCECLSERACVWTREIIFLRCVCVERCGVSCGGSNLCGDAEDDFFFLGRRAFWSISLARRGIGLSRTTSGSSSAKLHCEVLRGGVSTLPDPPIQTQWLARTALHLGHRQHVSICVLADHFRVCKIAPRSRSRLGPPRG